MPVSSSETMDPLEKLLKEYLNNFIQNNASARTVANGLRITGPGLWPLVDHITFRAEDAVRRGEEFRALGCEADSESGSISFDTWCAEILFKKGFPAIVVEQALGGDKGKNCLIPEWIKNFSENTVHHIGLRVDDIEQAIFFLEKQGIAFSGKIMGDREAELRQVFTAPEQRDGFPHSALKLVERKPGFAGFYPPQDMMIEATKAFY